MPPASSVMRKRVAMPTARPKKLGATKLSEMPDATADLISRGAHETKGFEPGTPSPKVTSKRPTEAYPTTPDKAPGPAAGTSRACNFPKVPTRNAEKKHETSVPSSPRPSLDQGADQDTLPLPCTALTLPKRDARHLAPPQTMDMADWDVWGMQSALDTMLGGFGTEKGGTKETVGRQSLPVRGTSATQTRQSQNAKFASRSKSDAPASLDQFVEATSAEAVSFVGRAALALGAVVVDSIEGTADFVQNAASAADRIANRVSTSPTELNRRGAFGKVLANLSPGARSPCKSRQHSFLSAKSPLKKLSSISSYRRSPLKTASNAALLAAAANDEWGWAAVNSPAKGELQGSVSSAVAHYRRELDSVNRDNKELREDLAKLRGEIIDARDANESIKKQNLGLQCRQAQRDHSNETSDPLHVQVRHQLENLVAEKAKLAQENDELWRENESLQELLLHSNMATQAESLYSPGGLLADLCAQQQQRPFENAIAGETGGGAGYMANTTAELMEGEVVCVEPAVETAVETAETVSKQVLEGIQEGSATEEASPRVEAEVKVVEAVVVETTVEVSTAPVEVSPTVVEVSTANENVSTANVEPREGKENVGPGPGVETVARDADAIAKQPKDKQGGGGKKKKGRKGKK